MEMPLFPLHLVLFPGVGCPLHVFEVRYRAMMEHILSGDRRFGVVAIRQGQEVGGDADVFDIGTIAEVEAVQRSEDGRMAIAARGIERFRIEQRLPDDPFPRATIRVLADEMGGELRGALTSARAAVHRYLSVVAKLRGTEVVAPGLGESDAIKISYALADAVQLDLPERQRLLEAATAADRLALVERAARAEARLLEVIGPPVGHDGESVHLN